MKKAHINILLILIFISIGGCMSTAARFWNNGIPMSEKKSKVYDECTLSIYNIYPAKTEAEKVEFYKRLRVCMESKGY